MSEINASVSLLKTFVNGLKFKIIDYRRLLRVIKTFLSNLNTKDVQKILSSLEKVSEFLNVFLLELTEKYASTMKTGLIIKSFDTSQIEESDLYSNLSEKTYNEQVEVYNNLIVRFDLIRNKLENSELITSDNKTLVIDVFNREFKAKLGSVSGEGNRLSEALNSTTSKLKMVAKNASLLPVAKIVGKKSDPTAKIKVINWSAFDLAEPKSILLENRKNRKVFEYVCQSDERPVINIKKSQIFEPNDELDRHESEKVPSESTEPDYVENDWRSDFGDDSDYSTGTNSEYDLDDSSNKIETNPTFEDTFEDNFKNTLSELMHMDKFVDKQFAQHLTKLPLQECCLLPNGSKNPTYRSEGKMFMLKNSCGFDSIAQILLANVTDYPNFENASQQNSQIVDLILKLRAGPCSKAASLRDDYLVSKNLALAKSGGQAPTLTINLFGSIRGVWEKYFDELPSAYRHFTCHPENRSKKSAFEIVKFGPTRKISIEEELNSFTNNKLRCRLCKNISETYFELQNYLFINFNISAGNEKYKCKLNMFPEKLNFLKTKFRLAGVIEGDSEHFKAHVRRINGDWELYDDLKEKVTKCFAFDVIAPEAVVYIRE